MGVMWRLYLLFCGDSAACLRFMNNENMCVFIGVFIVGWFVRL